MKGNYVVFLSVDQKKMDWGGYKRLCFTTKSVLSLRDMGVPTEEQGWQLLWRKQNEVAPPPLVLILGTPMLGDTYLMMIAQDAQTEVGSYAHRSQKGINSFIYKPHCIGLQRFYIVDISSGSLYYLDKLRGQLFHKKKRKSPKLLTFNPGNYTDQSALQLTSTHSDTVWSQTAISRTTDKCLNPPAITGSAQLIKEYVASENSPRVGNWKLEKVQYGLWDW